MSEENVETVRRVNDAFRAADWDAALSPYDDEAELDMTRMPAGGVYRGPACVHEFFGRWIAAWDRFEAERLDLIDAGDAVILTESLQSGRAAGLRCRCVRRTCSS
jgi:ketosteroid isomerase-like protein